MREPDNSVIFRPSKKRKRPTPEHWREARLRWESDSRQSMKSVSEAMGVSLAAVSRRVQLEKWTRAAEVESARREANRRAGDLDSDLDSVEHKKPLPESIVEGVDRMAEVISTHRRQWREHGSLFTLASIQADFENGKKAKISAEMLAIRQRAERIAWGLDDNGKKEVLAVVEWQP